MDSKQLITLCCYLCGRQFGSASLQIHLKSCQKKFNIEQSKKQPKMRIKCTNAYMKVPNPPILLPQILQGKFDEVTLQAYNQEALKIHKYSVLPACKYCGRTFKQQSLKPHQNGCQFKDKSSKPIVKQQQIDEIRKPRTLKCCVCGRDFGLTSLKIHYPQCIQKFKKEESLKQKQERRKLPQFPQDYLDWVNNKSDWSNQQIDQFNNSANELYRNKGLVQCQNCKRKFFPESILKHKKNCILINGQSESFKAIQNNLKRVNSFEALPRKPKVLMCHICGRQFGLTSLRIHISQCASKFINQQNKKPLKERKILPVFASQIKFTLQEAERWPMETIQQYNQIANSIYRNQSMSQCYICHRKFLQQSLPKHLKYCEKYNKNKSKSKQKSMSVLSRPKSSASLVNQTFKKPRVLVCHICGRQFGLTSLIIHQRQCQIKFISQQNKKVQSQRKELPTLPTTDQQFNLINAQKWSNQKIESYNEIANKVFRDKSLYPCKYCHRKFFEQSLPKHLKHCQKNNNSGIKSKQSLNVQKKTIDELRKPKVLMCCVCGREFGLSSLYIHQRQCQKKFMTEQKNKPIKQRKNLPKMPQQLDFDIQNAENWNNEQIQEFNEIANNIYRQQSLDSCPICFRKFFRQSLPKHLKFCAKNKEKQQQKKSLIQAKARRTFNNSLNKQKVNSLQRMNSLKMIKKPNSTFQKIQEEQIHHQHEEDQDNDDSLNSNKKQTLNKKEKVDQQQQIQRNIQGKCLREKFLDKHKKKYQNEFNDTLSEKQEHMEETFKSQNEIDQSHILQNNRQDQNIQEPQLSKKQQIKQEQQEQQAFNNPSHQKQIHFQKTLQNITQKASEQKPQQFNQQIKTQKFKNVVNNSNNDIIKQNKSSRQPQNQANNQTVKCIGCNRQFNNDRIQKHQEICKKAQEVRQATYRKEIKKNQVKIAKETNQTFQNIERSQCSYCRRMFTTDRLLKHQQICKGSKKSVKIQNLNLSNREIDKKTQIIEQKLPIQANILDLSQCLGCNRKFTKDRIQKHQQICKKAKQAIFNKNYQNKKQASMLKSIQTQKLNQQKLDQIKSIKRQSCKKCGKKFDIESLIKHFEICKGINDQITNKIEKNMNVLPPTLAKTNSYENKIPKEQQNLSINLQLCVKCGRKFNSDRLSKHIEVCKGTLNKLEIDPKDMKNKRKMVETKFSEANTKSVQNKQQVSITMLKDQTEGQIQNLVQCQKCQRKFNVQRLQKHRGVCKGNFTIKTVNIKKQMQQKEQMKVQGLQQFTNEQLLICEICNRKFNSERIVKHKQVCKGTKIKNSLNKTKNEQQQEQLRKTSKQFYNMVRQIKEKKKQQRQIDLQLQDGLNQINKSVKVSQKPLGKANKTLYFPKIDRRNVE